MDKMNLNLTRSEVCDLMIATLGIRFEAEDELRDENTTESRKQVLKNTIEKWKKLHDEIEKQIREFDETIESEF